MATILNKKKTLHFLNRNLTNLTQTHYFTKNGHIKATHLTIKTAMQKSFKLDQAFLNNDEKKSNSIFKSLSLQDFEHVYTLFGRLSNQNIEIQQITYAKYTVLMLCVCQNDRKTKAFCRSRPYQE